MSEVTYVVCNGPLCGFKRVPIKEGTRGTLSGKCPDCGAQILIRSPAGVAKWRPVAPATGEGGGTKKPAELDALLGNT